MKEGIEMILRDKDFASIKESYTPDRNEERKALDESLEYTWKNFKDQFIVGDYRDMMSVYKTKLDRTCKEFMKHYNIDINGLYNAIKDFNEKSEYEVIDIYKIDKFHHLHLALKLDYRNEFGNTDLPYFYMLFYRLVSDYQLNARSGYYTKYTMPFGITIDKKEGYIAFVTFDEKEVDRVDVLASRNMYDITSPILLKKLPNSITKACVIHK